MGRNVMGNEHCACIKKEKSGLPRKCKDYQEKQDCHGNVRTTRKSRTVKEMYRLPGKVVLRRKIM